MPSNFCWGHSLLEITDFFQSMKHVPIVKIADIANIITKLTDLPQEHILQMMACSLTIHWMPKLSGHPVTGVADTYMFNWFHQENCIGDKVI